MYKWSIDPQWIEYEHECGNPLTPQTVHYLSGSKYTSGLICNTCNMVFNERHTVMIITEPDGRIHRYWTDRMRWLNPTHDLWTEHVTYLHHHCTDERPGLRPVDDHARYDTDGHTERRAKP